MALQILAGTRPADIPIEVPRLVPIVDWRQLQRWRIDPARLPPGTDIRFRTPTLFEAYRWYIVGTIGVLAAQLVLITALLTQRRRRRRAEIDILTREAMIRGSYQRIRQLNARLINAQEAAWAAVARELHDDICQELVGLSMGVNELRHGSGDIQEAGAQHALSRLRITTLHMIESVRRLSHDLHPAALRLVGLAAALRTHCVEVERRHDVQVWFDASGSFGDLHPDVALCLFRIAQEALRNGALHGDARRLAVTLSRSDTHVELTIVDDGKGFDVEAVRHSSNGLGLVSMEERAHLAGGDVQVASRPGGGTTVRVRIPASASATKGSYAASARVDRR
jgi:signal transduction histidine kinase